MLTLTRNWVRVAFLFIPILFYFLINLYPNPKWVRVYFTTFFLLCVWVCDCRYGDGLEYGCHGHGEGFSKRGEWRKWCRGLWMPVCVHTVVGSTAHCVHPQWRTVLPPLTVYTHSGGASLTVCSTVATTAIPLCLHTVRCLPRCPLCVNTVARPWAINCVNTQWLSWYPRFPPFFLVLFL